MLAALRPSARPLLRYPVQDNIVSSANRQSWCCSSTQFTRSAVFSTLGVTLAGFPPVPLVHSSDRRHYSVEKKFRRREFSTFSGPFRTGQPGRFAPQVEFLHTSVSQLAASMSADRSYGAAVRELNSLQTNAVVLDAQRRSGGKDLEQQLPDMHAQMIRAGIQV
jgi:hypothetical protein